MQELLSGSVAVKDVVLPAMAKKVPDLSIHVCLCVCVSVCVCGEVCVLVCVMYVCGRSCMATTHAGNVFIFTFARACLSIDQAIGLFMTTPIKKSTNQPATLQNNPGSSRKVLAHVSVLCGEIRP